LAEKLQLIDDTGAQIALLGSFEALTTAAWSPDGQQVVYSADNGLCILNVVNLISVCPLENTMLTAADYALASRSPAAWSADGNWLGFQAVERDALQCFRLFLLDLSTNTVVDPEFPSCTQSSIYWSRAAP
jgi:Tol biopolymer transport system component